MFVLTHCPQYAGGLIGCAHSTSYETLLAARIIHAFASSVCLALPVQLVNDIFFLHERGTKLGFYTGMSATNLFDPAYTDRVSKSLLGRWSRTTCCRLYAHKSILMDLIL